MYAISVVALLFALIKRGQGQHVVFEEVGQVATSLSYLHVAIPLNISGIAQLVKDYKDLLEMKDIKRSFPFEIDHEFYARKFDDRFTERVIGPAMNDFAELLKALQFCADHFDYRLSNLTHILPTVAQSTATAYDTELIRF